MNNKGDIQCRCGNRLFKVYYDFDNGYVDCHCPICYTRINLAGPEDMYQVERIYRMNRGQE